jgi:hypothetical protein
MKSIFITSNSSKTHMRQRSNSFLSWSLALFVALAYIYVSIPMVLANGLKTPKAAAFVALSIPSSVGDTESTHHTLLPAVVDLKEQSQLSQNVDQLMNVALSKKAAFTKSESAVSHYQAPKHKTWTMIKNASNFLVPWHGFGPSSEAGDVILNEKIKLKSLEAAEYARQKEVDETHLVVVEKILCLAETLGAQASLEEPEGIESALGELSALTSPADAQKTLALIKTFDINEVTEALSNSDSKPLSISQRKRKWKELSESFISNDPIVQEVTNRLHLYNKRGKLTNIGGHFVQTSLGAAILLPTPLTPALQGCLMTYQTKKT